MTTYFGVLNTFSGVPNPYSGLSVLRLGMLIIYSGVLNLLFGVLNLYLGVLSSHLGVSSRHLGVLSSYLGVSSRAFLACFRGFWGMRGEGEYLRSVYLGILKNGERIGLYLYTHRQALLVYVLTIRSRASNREN